MPATADLVPGDPRGNHCEAALVSAAQDGTAYLRRIGYTAKPRLSAAVLGDLQEAHLLHVPFENLDIRAGRVIRLEIPALFEKIVLRRRGGFCYELNGLFHWLLVQVGFDATLASGRVFTGDGFGPEFDHMVILARAEDQTFLVDVGFGDFSLRPLRFAVDQPIDDRAGRFLIEQDGTDRFRVSRFADEAHRYVPEYTFSTTGRALEDFAAMCTYHQTSPDSHFTRGRVCSKATATGRITLTDDRLIVTEAGRKSEVPVTGAGAFNRMLDVYFRLTP